MCYLLPSLAAAVAMYSRCALCFSSNAFSASFSFFSEIAWRARASWLAFSAMATWATRLSLGNDVGGDGEGEGVD